MKKKSVALRQKKFSIRKATIVTLNGREQDRIAGGAAVKTYPEPCYTLKKCVIE